MNLFIVYGAFLAIIAGKGDSQSRGHHDSHHNNQKQDHHKNGHGDKHGNGNGNKHGNGHGNKDDKGHGNKHDNGHGDNHLPAPDSEDSKECDVEYVFSESEIVTERCRDGKEFFYTNRYKNETFCSNSNTIDDGECWWDTSMESNCLESTECVWLTNSAELGMCYCSESASCKACEHQTPAPTVNPASFQCPDKCEVYYLGCIGMYCKCIGECTDSVDAGCSEPINAGCHSYYLGEDDKGDREDGEDDTITDEINDLIDASGKTVIDKIVDFVDEDGEGRYEIFGDFAYEYRNGHLMRIISTSLLDLDDVIQSENDENDWLDDLLDGFEDLINGSEEDESEDVGNDWDWSWFSEDDDNAWDWSWFSEDDDDNDWSLFSEDESEEDNDDWPWSWFGR